ncbi:hypothetical protein ACIBN2_37815, partial [Streptomyces sp. NPDC050534]
MRDPTRAPCFLQNNATVGSIVAVVGIVLAAWSASEYVAAFIRAANAVAHGTQSPAAATRLIAQSEKRWSGYRRLRRMLVLSRSQVEDLLDTDSLIDALAPAMADLSAGRASVPDRVAALVPEHD